MGELLIWFQRIELGSSGEYHSLTVAILTWGGNETNRCTWTNVSNHSWATKMHAFIMFTPEPYLVTLSQKGEETLKGTFNKGC